MRKQLFILDREMLDAMKWDDVQATWNDMEELKIAEPPFLEMAIQIPYGRSFMIVERQSHLEHRVEDTKAIEDIKDVPYRVLYDMRKQGAEWINDTQFQVYKNGRFVDYFIAVHNDPGVTRETGELITKISLGTAGYLMKYLIVALATRNVERHTTHNALAKFGLGKKGQGKDYEYVTTLKIGELVEHDGKPTTSGDPRRPHLRRGHVRDQRYGPSREYVKRIFIQPIFVNGYNPDTDPGRDRYNVRKSHG